MDNVSAAQKCYMLLMGSTLWSDRARKCGVHHLRITLNGMDIAGSPFQFSVQTPNENIDPLNVHPDQLKDIENCVEGNPGTNPVYPRVHSQYILNGDPRPEYEAWTPPSAPSTEAVYQGCSTLGSQRKNGPHKGTHLHAPQYICPS